MFSLLSVAVDLTTPLICGGFSYHHGEEYELRLRNEWCYFSWINEFSIQRLHCSPSYAHKLPTVCMMTTNRDRILVFSCRMSTSISGCLARWRRSTLLVGGWEEGAKERAKKGAGEGEGKGPAVKFQVELETLAESPRCAHCQGNPPEQFAMLLWKF